MRIDVEAWMLLVGCVAVAAAPSRLLAQDPDSARAVLARDGLCPDAEVQISTTFAERFRGRCVLQDGRLLVVRDPRRAAGALHRGGQHLGARPRTRPGVITGAWLGAGLGGALSALFVRVFCDYRCRDELIEYGAGRLATGALTGALAGGFIGSGTRVWIRLYPRP